MRAYIDIDLFDTPKEVGGKNGGRKVKLAGQAQGRRGQPRGYFKPDGSIGATYGDWYIPVFDEAGEHIGDMSMKYNSILAPRESTVEVVK